MTKTDVPDTPLAGDVDIDAAVALVDANGSARAARTRNIVAVAARSRQGVRLGDARGLTSATQRVPSQKDMLWLRSATRLTARVPWLCGPASRRVCYFGEAGRSVGCGQPSVGGDALERGYGP